MDILFFQGQILLIVKIVALIDAYSYLESDTFQIE